MLPKTFKRETAMFLLVAFLGVVIYAMASDDPAIIMARAQIVATLALPVLAFVATAFGMDWLSKQTEWGGPAGNVPPDWPSGIARPERHD